MHMFTPRSGIWRKTDLLKFPRVTTEGRKDIFGKEIKQDAENANQGVFKFIFVFS